jgi:hypothetical protein
VQARVIDNPRGANASPIPLLGEQGFDLLKADDAGAEKLVATLGRQAVIAAVNRWRGKRSAGGGPAR